MPTLSIVIPTKNEEEHLPTLLRSIKNQTLQPSEVIVADANSSDRTRDIARESGAKIVEGGLPGPGRNRGAAVSTADLVLFLDADVNLTDVNFLQGVVDEFEGRGLDVATPDVHPISDNRLDLAGHKIYNRYVRMVEKVHPHAAGFCILVRKPFHDRIGGFDETVVFCEDHDYARRSGKSGKFGYLSPGHKVHVSNRRFERDGRLAIAIKFLLAELHLLTFGPIRHNAFNYTFGHKKKSSTTKS